MEPEKYLEYWELFRIILLNLSKYVLRKKERSLGYFLGVLSSIQFFYSRYSDTDKSGWFNKWINPKPTIHPIMCYWILRLYWNQYIQYALPGLDPMDQRNKDETFLKTKFSKIFSLFRFFWWPVKDLNVFVSAVQEKRTPKYQPYICPSSKLLSLFRVIFIFEIPVFSLFNVHILLRTSLMVSILHRSILLHFVRLMASSVNFVRYNDEEIAPI